MPSLVEEGNKMRLYNERKFICITSFYLGIREKIMKIHIKDMYTPIVVNNKIIFGTMAERVEIEDANQDICNLIDLLRENYTFEEICRYSKLNKEEIREVIELLDSFGVLENTDVSQETVNEERYKTNLKYFSFYSRLKTSSYKMQLKLNQATVALFGIGGSALTALNLVGMGIGKIMLIDYDCIEESNLSRQLLYAEENIGSLKIEVAEKKLKEINRDIEIKTYNMMVTNAEDIDDIVAQADIVINSIDTPPIQAARWVNYACMKNNKILVQGGLTAHSIVLDVFTRKTGCYDCFLLSSMAKDEDFSDQLKYVTNEKFNNFNTSFAPNVSLLSGLISSEVGRILAGYHKPLIEDKCLSLNLSDLSINYINDHKRVEKCPTCGGLHVNRKEPVSIEKLMEIAGEL